MEGRRQAWELQCVIEDLEEELVELVKAEPFDPKREVGQGGGGVEPKYQTKEWTAEEVGKEEKEGSDVQALHITNGMRRTLST